MGRNDFSDDFVIKGLDITRYLCLMVTCSTVGRVLGRGCPLVFPPVL